MPVPSTSNKKRSKSASLASSVFSIPSYLGHTNRTVGPALEELQLLNHSVVESRDRSDHELRTAPLLTRGAYLAAGFPGINSQYGVLGSALAVYDQAERDVPDDPRLYLNTNAPFSALVCGVQGSGKSHTVSVLLENMMIAKFPAIGALEKALTGLVLHFGEGGPSSRPCEAAWVGVSNFPGVIPPPIRVFVSRSSLQTMRGVYSALGNNVTVEPLAFSEEELDAEAFLSMMSVGSSENAPLYIQIILSILRDMGETYSFSAFQERLEEHKKNFNPAQLAGLEQRMALLYSFLERDRNARQAMAPRFVQGQLTIIDLSDPFIDPAAACGLFEIVTRLFVRAEVGTGKLLVVDEAHKYLSANKGNSGLTKSLLSLIRQQRHLAMRVIISTQEPTVVPAVLLDLCSVAILHRFASPAWWEHIAQHVSAHLSADEAFNHVVTLQTGEAIVLAPSALSMVKDPAMPETNGPSVKMLSQLGRRYILMKTRKRVTMDGGASILVL
ncbi:hypothetical protein EUX98_g521 [Antrodiella citrinella]|uniref:Zona occludens toxin N-terminal domain-containing protein n=1 Tax=Antrodiella citrinella TaxID=2447956 RepID=A0A4S4NCB8_9APHY|nr:hypothetical protein EUX98_g521 [Antrodiella citrinella]